MMVLVYMCCVVQLLKFTREIFFKLLGLFAETNFTPFDFPEGEFSSVSKKCVNLGLSCFYHFMLGEIMIRNY